MKIISFRNDLQVLRAFAVIFVFLFHLDFNFFKFGYLGVDIFFFISGYLITQILFLDYLNNKKINFKSFFLKRTLRILPLYLLVILLSIIIFSQILSPYHLKELIQSSNYATFFLSNIYFLLKFNYFDLEAIFKPLLHTWSLGIEMQFYVIYPFILLFLLKLKGSKITIFNILLFLNLLFISYFQYKDNFTFYFPLSRSFEFLVGIICALSNFNKKFDFVSFILISIFLLVSFINYDIDFSKKLLCVMIIYLIIFFKLIPNFLINNFILNYIGKISYSIYLIHWPLIVGFSYYIFRDLLIYEKVIIFFSTVLISIFTYKYIEIFFNNRKNIKLKIISIVIFIISILLLNYKIIELDYFEKDLNENQISLLNDLKEKSSIDNQCKINFNLKLSKIDKFAYSEECNNNDYKTLLIFGDSHSLDLFNAVSYGIEKLNIISFSQDDCRLSDDKTFHKSKNCNFDDIFLFINEQKDIDKIIYTQKGSYLFKNKYNQPKDLDAIDRLKGFLIDISNSTSAELIFFGPQREYTVNLNNFIHMQSNLLGDRFFVSENLSIIELDKYLKNELSNYDNIEYISKIDTLQNYKNYSLLYNNTLLYNNKSHWSKKGEVYFGKLIKELELIKINGNN